MTQTPAEPYTDPKAVPVPDAYRVPPRVAASTTWRCRECGTKLVRNRLSGSVLACRAHPTAAILEIDRPLDVALQVWHRELAVGRDIRAVLPLLPMREFPGVTMAVGALALVLLESWGGMLPELRATVARGPEGPGGLFG